MLSTVSDSDLVTACQILFSPYGNRCSVDFVKSLNTSTLKKAYRRKALETHPDRCEALGVDKTVLSEKFRKVKTAYEVLKPVTSGDKITILQQEKKTKPDVFYSGTMPLNELRLGQFLYYSGAISWKTLIDAISWQHRGKPLYGQIARDWGMLSSEEIQRIMKCKNTGEKIGEYARAKGYLSLFQHLAIMGKQKKTRALFGEFFIRRGIYSRRQMDAVVKNVRRHNEKIIRGQYD